MDKDQLLALMIAPQTPVSVEWDTVLALYAEQLERVSWKLTDDEMFPLLAIGSAIYQKQCQQSDAEQEAAQAILRASGRGNSLG